MRHFRSSVWAATVLLVLCLGCHQRYEEGSHPPPMRPVPARPAGTESASVDRPKSSRWTVTGTVRLSKELVDLVPSQAFLFVIAREREDGGAPIAVLRVPLPEFPYDFTLVESHAMSMLERDVAPGEAKQMYLIARVDQDGHVGPPEPGDMEGACPGNPVSAGEGGCEIVIDRRH